MIFHFIPYFWQNIISIFWCGFNDDLFVKVHLPFLGLVYGLSAALLITPEGIKAPVQTVGCSFWLKKLVACGKVSGLQNLWRIMVAQYAENTQVFFKDVKTISVGISTLYQNKYLSRLVSLRGVGSILCNGKHCASVLVKEFLPCPR